MIGAVRELAPTARIAMHLHDTRGLGVANVHAALSMGVDLFESSIAGLGGCPFAGHSHARAAGNVCTEDAVFLCHELGIETGIDLDKLIEAARYVEGIIGQPLMGRVMHSGGLDKYRSRSGRHFLVDAALEPRGPSTQEVLKPIGNIPPAEAKARYYTSLDATPMAK